MTLSPTATPKERRTAIEQVAVELRADDRPILLGPFRSELGFEASYWQPFLAGLARRVPNFDKRASVITRGGLAPLYKSVAHQGIDLFALRDVTEVRRESMYDHKRTKELKQWQLTPWDEAVLHDAADALKIGQLFHTVHPSLMYWACAPYWTEEAGLKHLTALCDYTPLERLTIGGIQLPENFVAMRFYARATLPYPHPEVEDFVSHTAAVLAKQLPVVLLNAPGYDDHHDIYVKGENIHTIPENLAPDQNLAVQMAVMSKAKAFIGTYGGVAQTALRLGIPSVSFWHSWGGTMHAHFSLQSWLSKKTGCPFLAGSLADARLWEQIVNVPQRREGLHERVTRHASALGKQHPPTGTPPGDGTPPESGLHVAEADVADSGGDHGTAGARATPEGAVA